MCLLQKGTFGTKVQHLHAAKNNGCEKNQVINAFQISGGIPYSKWGSRGGPSPKEKSPSPGAVRPKEKSTPWGSGTLPRAEGTLRVFGNTRLQVAWPPTLPAWTPPNAARPPHCLIVCNGLKTSQLVLNLEINPFQEATDHYSRTISPTPQTPPKTGGDLYRPPKNRIREIF